jgi:hypothetical protein
MPTFLTLLSTTGVASFALETDLDIAVLHFHALTNPAAARMAYLPMAVTARVRANLSSAARIAGANIPATNDLRALPRLMSL